MITLPILGVCIAAIPRDLFGDDLSQLEGGGLFYIDGMMLWISLSFSRLFYFWLLVVLLHFYFRGFLWVSLVLLLASIALLYC